MKASHIGWAAPVVLVTLASPVLAELHYFTQGSTLYWTEAGGPVSSVGISSGAAYSGLSFDPSGNLWGSNVTEQTFDLIDPLTGNATAQFSYGADTGGEAIISFVFRYDDDMLQLIGMAGDTAYVFDAVSGNFVSGNDNFPGTDTYRFPSTAFDPVSSEFYGISPVDFSLYLLEPDGGPASLRGAITDSVTSEALHWQGAGGSFFGGQYWSGVRVGEDLVFGTIDTTTAVFSEGFRFTGLGTGVGMGYAVVIPAPGAAFLALAGVTLFGWPGADLGHSTDLPDRVVFRHSIERPCRLSTVVIENAAGERTRVFRGKSRCGPLQGGRPVGCPADAGPP